MTSSKALNVALVYDRVNKWGGAERVLLVLHKIFPHAPLFTSVYDSDKAPWAKVFPKVYTSFLQKIPFAKNNHELLSVFMPLAFEQFDFTNYDLVISITSEAAKGIITHPQTFHVCYCLTPNRYLYSAKENYLNHPPKILNFPFFKVIAKPFVNYVRNWDQMAAWRPDVMIAISRVVQKRIKKYYKRNVELIFPPLSLDNRKEIKRTSGKEFYLVVSRLVAYKKVDLAIKTFNKLKVPLVIIGTGEQEEKLKRLANSNISFVKNLTDEDISHYYFNTKALIMPQVEDFGLVAVEAQFYGTPIIAYNKGGVKDTVTDGVTGILFKKQTTKSLLSAIKRFEKLSFSKEKLTQNAQRFRTSIFKRKLITLIAHGK